MLTPFLCFLLRSWVQSVLDLGGEMCLPLHDDKLFSHLTPFITSSNCVSRNLSMVSFDFPLDFLKYRASANSAS